MLKEETVLLKIVLIVSLIGMSLLFLLSAKLPRQAEDAILMSSLEEMPENAQVKIVGTITSIVDTPTIMILEIKDSSDTMKVITDKKGMELKLKKKMKVEVQGTIKMYKDEMEIEAAKIRILEKNGR
mgnify:CR=1 FL=1